MKIGGFFEHQPVSTYVCCFPDVSEVPDFYRPPHSIIVIMNFGARLSSKASTWVQSLGSVLGTFSEKTS